MSKRQQRSTRPSHDSTPRRDRAPQQEPRAASGQSVVSIAAASVLLVGIVVAVYWPVLSAQALSFDDGQFLTNNPLVQTPSWSSAGRFFDEVLEPSTVEGYYLPLSMVSLMLDYAAGGRPDNLFAFHRTNLILHVANTLLVVLLLVSLFRSYWPAFLVGLLFGLHPLTVEPIAWIGERKTLLATFFALLCLVVYVRRKGAGRWRWHLALVALYALAILCKPTAAPLPLLLLVLDYWPLERLSARAVLQKAPLFAVAAASAIITLMSHVRTAGIVWGGAASFSGGVLLALYNLAFYARKIVWPHNLTSVYALPAPFSLSNGIVLLSALGVVVGVIGVLLLRRRTRGWLACIAFFVIAISPTLGVLRYSWVVTSDKYVYLPCVGLLMLLAWRIGRSWDAASRGARVIVVALVSFVATAEAWATRDYLARWQTTEGLFRYMVRLAPDAHMPHYNLAHELQTLHRAEEAEAEYRTVLRINPDHADSHNNLGLILASTGRFDEAIEHYREALRVDEHYANAMSNMASLLSDMDRNEEAVTWYRKALAVTPGDPRIHNGLGTALHRMGRFDEAMTAYRDALRIDPEYMDAQQNLGFALADAGRSAEAVEVLRAAISLGSDNLHIHRRLGMLLASLGKAAEAIDAYQNALRSKPNDAVTHNLLGDSLFELQRFDEAASAYQTAVDNDPEYAAARSNLAIALACAGRTEQAVAAYRTALRGQPQDASLHNNLGAALLDLGESTQALDELHEAVRLSPEYASAHFNLGRALAAAGRTDEAAQAFKRVLEINPSDRGAREQLDAIEATLSNQQDE